MAGAAAITSVNGKSSIIVRTKATAAGRATMDGAGSIVGKTIAGTGTVGTDTAGTAMRGVIAGTTGTTDATDIGVETAAGGGAFSVTARVNFRVAPLSDVCYPSPQ